MLRNRVSFALSALVSAVALAAACSANNDASGFGDGGSGGAGASGAGTSTSTGIGGGNFTTSSGGGSGPGDCSSTDTEDKDKDGFTKVDGDCNDCDPNVNPGAIEVLADGSGGAPAEPADEDCDGQIDNVAPPCDDGLALDDVDAMDGAKAVDLCHQATGKTWGVMNAAYVRANGSPASPGLTVGLLDGFGPNVAVQGGSRMLAVSSGHSRTPNQPGSCGSKDCSDLGPGVAPMWFPQDVPACPGDTAINDDIGLEVKLRAPTNATGYSFLFRFYSFEYPEWVCTSFNDQFIALVSPEPMGSVHGNISFDSMTNPVSVNVAFFDVCAGCPQGTNDMAGTGFDTWDTAAGATSWLKSTAPIGPGEEFTIRWAIWDTGDAAWDSTALVDGFQWIANGGTVGVGTEPIPDPK